MTAMSLYGLSTPWNEAAYQALLAIAEERAGYCVLVCRAGASDACHDWIKKYEASLESVDETMMWPGSIVYNESDRATLLKFRITSELIDGLRAAASSPFEWLGPKLPEDLSFLRTDGRPWFVSIAHESDAFFKLQAEEVDDLRRRVSVIELVAEGEDQAPEERY